MRGAVLGVEASVSVDSVFRSAILQDTETSSTHVYALKSLHAFSD